VRRGVISTQRVGIVTLNGDVRELEELASSAGYTVIYEVIQRRERPEATTFVGRGKIEDLKLILQARPVDLLLIDGVLKPSQHYNLENSLKVECVDRVRLVLNIFTSRANDRESKLQVERARLQYEIPLLKEWIHSAKMGEHPGFLGGGEYAVDVYYDLIKKRIKKIDEELKSINQSHVIRRGQRQKRGQALISLAGYTNAGKSALLNALTGGGVLVENRMFSTLSTTTRKVRDVGRTILITDTIGFLDDLPTFVIEAFKNTIEEIFTADLVLLTIDSSESRDEMRRKILTSKKILYPDLSPEKVILVLNKIDIGPGRYLDEEALSEWIECSAIVKVSATTGEGIDHLMDMISQYFMPPNRFEMDLPYSDKSERFISSLRALECLQSVRYGRSIHIEGACEVKDLNRIKAQTALLKGTFVLIGHPSQS
jgi:GTP-binding protein HflX